MPPVFLYQQWLQHRLTLFVRSSGAIELQGRKITMPPEQYGAALLQAYLGGASLKWIAEQAGIHLNRLHQWRRQPLFLMVVDWSKAIFSREIHEKLILNDYSETECHYISAEVALLEESLRVMIRMPLFGRFAKLGQRLISCHQHGIVPESYDLRLFRRLFLFFLALEYHWPGPAGHRLGSEFVPLAKEVVWPLLEEKVWIGPAMECVQHTVPLSRILSLIGEKLRDTLHRSIQ